MNRLLLAAVAVILIVGPSGCVSLRTARRMYGAGYSDGVGAQAELDQRSVDLQKRICEDELEAFKRWRKMAVEALNDLNDMRKGGGK